MTTIAFDGKTVAVDSQRTGGYMEYVRKAVWKSNTLIVGTGDAGEIAVIIDWLLGNAKEYPKVNSNSVAVYTFEKLQNNIEIKEYREYPTPIICGLSKGGFFSAGGGNGFAIGAMEAGATAKQAIKITARLDPNTGGKIHTYKIKD